MTDAKNAKKKTVKKAKTPPKDGVKNEEAAKERRQAKSIGITLPQIRVLKAISRSKELSYQQIREKTGYYSILTAILRNEYEDSLCSKKLVKEEVHDAEGRDMLAFSVTAAGKKALSEATKVK